MISSITSLDEFLPMFHNKDPQKSQLLCIEKDIIIYLSNKGIVMKTDPLQKQQEYFKNLKIEQEHIQSNGSIQLDLEADQSTQDVSILSGQETEFNISNNPIAQRCGRKMVRQHTFENQLTQ